jgi:hypothetical protein
MLVHHWFCFFATRSCTHFYNHLLPQPLGNTRVPKVALVDVNDCITTNVCGTVNFPVSQLADICKSKGIDVPKVVAKEFAELVNLLFWTIFCDAMPLLTLYCSLEPSRPCTHSGRISLDSPRPTTRKTFPFSPRCPKQRLKDSWANPRVLSRWLSIQSAKFCTFFQDWLFRARFTRIVPHFW